MSENDMIFPSFGDQILSPDIKWMEELDSDASNIENSHFLSFQQFLQFPFNNLSLEASISNKFSSDQENLIIKARNILHNLKSLDIFQPETYQLFYQLSLALAIDPKIALELPEDSSQYVVKCWVIGQTISTNLSLAFRLWRDQLFHPPPFSDRVSLQAVLLLLDTLVAHYEPTNLPPITSDEFEIIFALAYTSSRSLSPTLASFVLPHVIPLIVQSAAAHLVFRRMLPYCAMEDPKGRKVALSILVNIITNHERFPSSVSTWISLHRMYHLLYFFFHERLL